MAATTTRSGPSSPPRRTSPELARSDRRRQRRQGDHDRAADQRGFEPASTASAGGRQAGAARRLTGPAGRGRDDGARRRGAAPPQDATFKLRPRLFLEGNYFVDMHPGSPNAAEVDDGHTFPVNQTSYSVQLDQVLTTLQGDVRTDLQSSSTSSATRSSRYGGAEGFRELYRTSPPAFKYTSQVNQAVLGTEPGDLSGLIDGLDRVVRALGSNERHAAEPGHQLPHRHRLVRRPGSGARPGDPDAARHARRGRAGVREPERRVPAAPRVRARGAAGRALDAGDARRGDAVRRTAPRASSRSPSCAA